MLKCSGTNAILYAPSVFGATRPISSLKELLLVFLTGFTRTTHTCVAHKSSVSHKTISANSMMKKKKKKLEGQCQSSVLLGNHSLMEMKPQVVSHWARPETSVLFNVLK